ncbi:MAG: hypothetical protein WAP51_02975 [Candidatus Sungiibacteriota bacterium]
MLKKVLIVIGIVLAAAAAGFIGLVVYAYFHPEFGLKEPGAAEQPKTEAKTQEPPRKTEAVKPAEKPSLPSSSEPVIVSVQFPKRIALEQEYTMTVNFQDREGDVAKLLIHDLDRNLINEVNYYDGETSGSLTYFKIVVGVARIGIDRLILVDAAGNQSAPYILTYQAGDIGEYYDRYDAEVLMARPVERRKKIHFFVLSNTKNKTELENGSSFASEEASTGTVSPAVAKMLEASVLPQINGLWDQCGVAFDLGMVKAVRPEKVNLPDGGTLSSVFGMDEDPFGYIVNNVPFFIVNNTDAKKDGIKLIRSALPSFGIPTGDIAIFIVGPKLVDINDAESLVYGAALKNLAVIAWRHIHFQNETRGEIITPTAIMDTLAHELGHALGLDHPGEGNAVPENKFSKFNLMQQGKIRSELIPEQCSIVTSRF